MMGKEGRHIPHRALIPYNHGTTVQLAAATFQLSTPSGIIVAQTINLSRNAPCSMWGEQNNRR